MIRAYTRALNIFSYTIGYRHLLANSLDQVAAYVKLLTDNWPGI